MTLRRVPRMLPASAMTCPGKSGHNVLITIFRRIEALFWPDLFIIGGGASKRMDKFVEHLSVKAEVVPAQLLNEAGIIGAALAGEILVK